MGTASNLWRSDQHASAWLEMLPGLPRLDEADAALLEWLPERVDRFLDLGTGNGRLIDLVLDARPLVPGGRSRLLAGDDRRRPPAFRR